MTRTLDHTFSTPEPIELHLRLGGGSVELTATDSAETTVAVTGHEPERVRVEHTGRRVDVTTERRTGFVRDERYRLTVSLPAGSRVTTRLGSADLTARGELGTTRVRTGSGDVRLEHQVGPTVVETGSGSVAVENAGQDLRLRTGSGDAEIGTVAGTLVASTGSGRLRLGGHTGAAVLKTGSGGIHVRRAGRDLTLSSGSGDLTVERTEQGRLAGKSGSGNLRVGIPAGVAVWTDARTGSGRIRSDLPSSGAPQHGQPYLELRATTGSGDVTLSPASVE